MSLAKIAAVGRFLFPKAGKGVPPGVRSAIDRFRSLPVEQRGQVPLYIYLLGTGTYDYKFSKEEVSYTNKTPIPSQTCANCVSAYQQVKSGRYICDWMEGDIDPQGWCDRWSP